MVNGNPLIIIGPEFAGLRLFLFNDHWDTAKGDKIPSTKSFGHQQIQKNIVYNLRLLLASRDNF